MITLVEEHRAQIESLCRKYHVTRLELFGSAARGDFEPATSDLDFFVEFEPLGWKGSSDRYFGLLHGLEDLFQRDVDLVERVSAANPHFIELATKHRQLLYAA
jgi:predicted nucleotidyltransferase